jgi:hypothetical protein
MTNILHRLSRNRPKIPLLSPIVARSTNRLAMLDVPKSILPVIKRGILAKDRRYLFIRNAKAACSTVASAIYYWETGKNALPQDTVHSSAKLLLGKDNYKQLITALHDPSVFRFTTIRNPTARSISAFTNFFMDRSNEQSSKHIKPMMQFGYRPDQSAEKNFDAFLLYVERCIAENPIQMDAHFRPQFFNIRPDIVSYDRICRVENLNSELEAFMRQFSLPQLPDHGATRHNASSSSFTPSASQLTMIKRLYAIDFHVFGYDIDR